MSAPIQTSATHLPGQLVEVSQALALAELALPSITRPNNIVITHDTENQTMTVTATLPMVPSIGINGVSYVASDYLST
ncbi:hypothetical protein [Gloeothece verrucosa]|uniref:Uncharacterized protein n=1 Tax=Gloeothece verrucosa (strain PCC 7822) TaxID=497965 RepID=E0UAF4_GLOV7|nr:hypothetical protein [Gloeothece verrucosa]ADN12695.1 hypothetical protein Cyan7822_0659 [Gloeothece verrucosa PCC 7822]